MIVPFGGEYNVFGAPQGPDCNINSHQIAWIEALVCKAIKLESIYEQFHGFNTCSRSRFLIPLEFCLLYDVVIVGVAFVTWEAEPNVSDVF
jgi:hypothetical protein